ncbi:Hyaluronan-binding protein 2 [Coemansia spiralis]|nr:Hyaluronan-binding protein 2 [Coemansia spiralis]
MATQVKVGSVAVCRQAQPQYRSADGPDVCTVNALTPGQDSCQGDSGSPTVITSGGSVQLAALTSSGVDLSNPGAADCAMPNGLAFYTHVYYFIDFIVSTSGRPQSAFTGTSKSDDKQSDASETSAGATLRHPRAYVAIAALIVAAAAAL